MEKGVTHDGRTISPRSSEASEGVKWLLQQETGCLFSKQHLITLSVSLLLLSLSFSPLSSFTHYQVYFFLNPQILHSLCRGSVSYKLLLFFLPSHAEFALYWEAVHLSELNSYTNANAGLKKSWIALEAPANDDELKACRMQIYLKRLCPCVNQSVFNCFNLLLFFPVFLSICHNVSAQVMEPLLGIIFKEICSHVGHFVAGYNPSLSSSPTTKHSAAPKALLSSCLKSYKHFRRFHQAALAAPIKGEHCSI